MLVEGADGPAARAEHDRRACLQGGEAVRCRDPPEGHKMPFEVRFETPAGQQGQVDLARFAGRSDVKAGPASSTRIRLASSPAPPSPA